MTGAATEFWTLGLPIVGRIESFAEHAERAGWDGLVLTDSQNLAPDVYIALALAARATERLQLGTGVTNPVTRHPAVTASAIATVQAVSQGRAVLGIGRGDSSLFHLGSEPAPLSDFERYLQRLHGFLAGEEVDLDGHASRVRWIDVKAGAVPLDVAATGPRVIACAARWAERITFAVGANPERIRWALEVASKAAAAGVREQRGLGPLDFGAFVNVAPHADRQVARNLVRGGVGAFAHFSGMGGSSSEGQAPADRAVFERIHHNYDRAHHTLGRARHAAELADDFLDRFAIAGPPKLCVDRLEAVVRAGVRRLVVIGASFDSDRAQARISRELLVCEVMPALRARFQPAESVT